MSCVKEFLVKYNYEADAVTFLNDAYQVLQSNQKAFEIFSSCVAEYEQDINFDHAGAFDKVHALSESTGIHKYTLELLFLICLTPHLKELYAAEGIAEDIYDNTVCDLKWKAKECRDLYGVWGCFVGWWTIDFFKLNRFAIGRLQYNLRQLSHDISSNGMVLQKGLWFISVHIPSSGPLVHADCQASYKQAAEFFRKRYHMNDIVFGCESWLMAPQNHEILPAHSNILKFMSDYTIVEHRAPRDHSNVWRIFNVMELPDDLSTLPEDTSLRRAFKAWLMKGNTIHIGFGVIFY